MNSLHKRIVGFDLARGVAVLGMIMVNFDDIFEKELTSPLWYYEVVQFIYGRAAVLFVLLAGVGVGLMSRRYLLAEDAASLAVVRRNILKRSIVLFVGGSLFVQFWLADILHFYGVFLFAAVFLVSVRGSLLFILSLGIFCIGSIIFVVNEGDPNIITILQPLGRAAVEIDDILFSGHYALFPWFAFVLLGMWLVRQKIFHEKRLHWQGLACSVAMFAGAEGINRLFLNWSHGDYNSWYIPYLDILMVIDVFPITPLFVISATGGGLTVIFAMMILANHVNNALVLNLLKYSGKLSLSIYIGHIVVARLLEKLFVSRNYEFWGPESSFAFVVSFIVLTLISSAMWFRFYSLGPFEWLLRRLSS